jgi:hypothetical protein
MRIKVDETNQSKPPVAEAAMKQLTSSDAKRIDLASARAQRTMQLAMALVCAALLVACSSSQEGGFWGKKKPIVVTEFQIEMQLAAAPTTPTPPTTAPATPPATAPATTRPTTSPATRPAGAASAKLPSGAPQPTKLLVNLTTGAGTFFDDEGKAWHYTLTPQRVEMLREALAKGDWQNFAPATEPAKDRRFVLTAFNAGAVVGQPVALSFHSIKRATIEPQMPFIEAYDEAMRVAKPLSRTIDLTR